MKTIVSCLASFLLASLTLVPDLRAAPEKTSSKGAKQSNRAAKPTTKQKASQRSLQKSRSKSGQSSATASSDSRDSAEASDGGETQPPVSVQNPTRESALRSLAITPFVIQKSLGSEVSPQQAKDVAAQIASELSAKSFMQAKVVEGNGLAKSNRDFLIRQLQTSELDGVVVGSLSPEGASFYILSKNGARLVASDVSLRLRLVKPETLKTLASEVVDEIVRSVPYRGFLTKETEDGVFELNLGSDHGIAKGQKFRVFDFESSDLRSTRIDRGEVQVLDVKQSTATVETTVGNHRLKPYMKIGFDERARGMVVDTQTPTRGYGLIGGEMLTIVGSSDPQYADRSYNMKATPGLALGLGWNKTSVRALLAQARNDDVDLVYMEVVGLYRLWEKTGGYNRFSFSVGGRYARFGVTTRRAITTPLESSSSLAPVFGGRWEHVIGGPVHAFLGGDLYYPMVNTGNGSGSSIAFAYGAGGELGAAIDLSQRISLEMGGKLHFLRRPIEGQSAVQERYTQFFADLIARF